MTTSQPDALDPLSPPRQDVGLPASGAHFPGESLPPSGDLPALGDLLAPAGLARTALRAVLCGDGVSRCPWSPATVGALTDHDQGWGTTPTSARGYFAALTLELVDSGLARWSQAARHDAWHLNMAGLDPRRVALFDDDDVDDLLDVPELIRNRAKIEAVVRNARACQDWELSDWQDVLEEAEVPAPGPAPETALDLPDSTAASRRLALVLRGHGIGLVGPVTAHRWLERTGRAPGHVLGCFRAAPGTPTG